MGLVKRLKRLESAGLIDSESTEAQVNFWADSPEEFLITLEKAGMIAFKTEDENE